MEYSLEFAKKMRAAMAEQGMGVRELGRLIGLEPSTISKHIGSDTRLPRQRPGLKSIQRYAFFLKMNPLHLARMNGYKFNNADLYESVGPILASEIRQVSPQLQRWIEDLWEMAL